MTTETHYNDRGQVEYTVDQYGIETHNVYDARGNVIETRTQAKDESGASGWLITRTLYDTQGRVEFATDSYFVLDVDYPTNTDRASSGTRTINDDLGRVKSTERYNGITIELVDDPDHAGSGLKITIKDFEWDSEEIRNKRISQNQTFYDQFGRVDYTIDEYGSETRYAYDLLGRQIETRYQSKDEHGDLQWVATRTVYDTLGRTSVTSDPFILQYDDTTDTYSIMPS